MASAFGKSAARRVFAGVWPLVVLGGCLWLLSQQVSADVFRDLPEHLKATPLWAWVAAVLFTALSFFSLGRYDGIAHRHLRTGVPARQARLSGMAAIALAQTLGFDLIWFAVIVLLALEISFTTPPFGLLLFVMKGVSPPSTTMRDIYVAALPFIGCTILLVGLLIVFPGIALWLPGLGK